MPTQSKRKNILLCYSRTHFDPGKDKKEQIYWGSSANILARSIYEFLLGYGDVTYIDPTELDTVRGNKYDIFVGQSQNFNKILMLCSIERSILFAVNMHPTERNRIIKLAAKKLKIPLKQANSGDIVDSQPILAAINSADAVICVGNEKVYNSYIKHGVSRNKIKMINYSTGAVLAPHSSSLKPSNKKRYLYIATELNLRKGFDIVDCLARYLANQYPGQFRLDIVGDVKNLYYRDKLTALKQDLGSNVNYLGWLKTNSSIFEKTMAKNDFLLFPSLEEGQAGSVLDSIRRGLVPLVSEAAGINYSPLGFLNPTNSDINKRIIDAAQNLSASDIIDLSKATTDYYRVNHSNFKHQLADTLSGAIDGELYPKLSVVLAIFNKEKTIKELLVKLYDASRNFGNIEFQIILDGCRDGSEKIVKDFFTTHNDFPVHYYKTPNIFEVKSNNIGLTNSKGKYCVIIQDDNFINNPNCFIEAIGFLEKNSKAAILGGLAGVNFYPRGHHLNGSGQISMTEKEVYWRQDRETDASLESKVFQVDACMRGPLFIRKDFLSKHGYLDEIYAPLYNDDMDLCFRAKKLGYRTYCILMDVENRSATITSYDSKRIEFWERIISKNSDIFYNRWRPTDVKNYSWQSRIKIYDSNSQKVLMALYKLKRQFSILTKRMQARALSYARYVKDILRKIINLRKG